MCSRCVCVCFLLTAVCVHLHGCNAKHRFRVWNTILGHVSLYLLITALIPFLLKLSVKPKSIVFWYRHQQAGHKWKENLSKHMLQCSQACVFILTGVHSSYQLPPAWAMYPLLVNTGTGPVSKPPNYNQLILFSPLFTTHRSYDKLCMFAFLLDDAIIPMWTSM